MGASSVTGYPALVTPIHGFTPATSNHGAMKALGRPEVPIVNGPARPKVPLVALPGTHSRSFRVAPSSERRLAEVQLFLRGALFGQVVHLGKTEASHLSSPPGLHRNAGLATQPEDAGGPPLPIEQGYREPGRVGDEESVSHPLSADQLQALCPDNLA